MNVNNLPNNKVLYLNNLELTAASFIINKFLDNHPELKDTQDGEIISNLSKKIKESFNN